MFQPRPIRSEEDHDRALEALREVWGKPDQDSIDRAELLAILIDDYEQKTAPLAPEFSPIDVIEARMADLGLSRADLELSIGQKGRVSEILAGKRDLTLPMIARLSKQLMVPTEMLMPKIPLRAAATG